MFLKKIIIKNKVCVDIGTDNVISLQLLRQNKVLVNTFDKYTNKNLVINGMVKNYTEFATYISNKLNLVESKNTLQTINPFEFRTLDIISRRPCNFLQKDIITSVFHNFGFDYVNFSCHLTQKPKLSEERFLIYRNEIIFCNENQHKYMRVSPFFIEAALRQFVQNKYHVEFEDDVLFEILNSHFSIAENKVGKKVIKYKINNTNAKRYLTYHEVAEAVRPVLRILLNEISSQVKMKNYATFINHCTISDKRFTYINKLLELYLPEKFEKSISIRVIDPAFDYYLNSQP
ncbi:MAG: hypothetical protein U0525_02340 [Patescibacteria group bacterium]